MNERQRLMSNFPGRIKAHRAKLLAHYIAQGLPAAECRALAYKGTKTFYTERLAEFGSDFPQHEIKAREIFRDTLEGLAR